MTLAERLKAKKCRHEQCTCGGEKFTIVGLSRRERAELQAKCSDRKTHRLDTGVLEGELLTRCVLDPETQKPVFTKRDEWDEIPAEVTGPLIGAVMKLNGYDTEDLGKKSQDD